MGALSDDSARSRLRGDGVRGVLGILATGPYSIVDWGTWVIRSDVPEECDVVSALSLVMDSEDPLVRINGQSRSRVLPSVLVELVSVSSLVPSVDAIGSGDRRWVMAR